MSVLELDITAHLAYALQLSLGGVFLFAAIPKARHPVRFRGTVAEYRLLPHDVTLPFAALVIATESFLALAFLTGWMTVIALPLAALTLVLFAIAVAITLRRGQRIPCGCFGGESENISRRSLARLSMLLGATMVIVLLGSSGVTVRTLLADGASGLGYLAQIASVTAFVTLAAAWLLSLPEVAFILRRLAQLDRGIHTETSGGKE